MSLDFHNFIDIEHHYDKIQQHAQVIRNKYAPTVDTAQYLKALFDFFLSDIKSIADEIYSGALNEVNKRGIKFSALELKECVINGTQACFSLYIRLIQGYNAGAMFKSYDKLEKDLEKFNLRMQRISQKESDSIYSQYSAFLKKERRATWGFRMAIISIFISILSIVISVIMNKASSTETTPAKSNIITTDTSIKTDFLSDAQLPSILRCDISNK